MDSNDSPRRKLLNFYVSAVVAGAAVALVLATWNQEWDTWRPLANALAAVVGLALAAELSSVSMHIGTSTMSIVHIPLIAAIFLFPPVYAMLVGAVTLLIVEAFVRRKPWIKIVFNISKEMLALGAAGSAYVILGGHPSTARFDFVPLAFIGAEIAYSAATSLAVSYAVSLSEGFELRESWLRVYGGSFVYDLFSTPLPVLLAYLYVWQQLPGVVLLAVPLLVVRHIYVQNLRLEQSSRELLELMVKNIEARDPYTSGHSQRVSQYARILARESGLSFRQVALVATAGLLHDLGKTYSEYAPLLLKEGRLTSDEKKLLETHPVRSAELVATISTLRGPVEQAVRHHHENFDGTGYPDGLAGQGIPIGARIIMIADTLDAMTTERPYRKALPLDRALDEIRKYSGKQFDPRLAEIACRSTAIRLLAAKASPSALATGPAAFERAGPVRQERAAVEHTLLVS